MRWVSRTDGSRGYYASQFRKVYGRPLDERLAGLDRLGARLPGGEPRGHPEVPDDAVQRPVAARPSAPCRGPTSTRRPVSCTPALNYPGIVGHIGAISLTDGSVAKLKDVKRPAMYTVTSLAYDPAAKTLFYTTDNNAYRDLVALDTRTHRTRTLIKDGRIGDLAFDRADRSLWGIRALQRDLHARPHPAPVHRLEARPLLALRRGRLRPRRLARRPRSCPSPTARSTASSRCACSASRSCWPATATPAKEFDFGSARAGRTSCSRRTGATSTAAPTTRASRTSSATTSRRGALEAVSNVETGLFQPGSRSAGTARRLPLHRRGLRAGDDRRRGRCRT